MKSRTLIAIPVCHKFSYGDFESDRPGYEMHEHNSDRDASEQVQALRDTWLRDVAPIPTFDYRLFYGEPHGRNPLSDEVFLDVSDGYADLPHKTKAIAQWALENKYDGLWKTDGDCFNWPDRIFRSFLQHKFGDYAGYIYRGKGASGAGYFLSKRSLIIIAEHAKPDEFNAEDVMVAKTLEKHGIFPNMIGDVQISPYPKYWFDLNKVTPHLLAAHAFTAESMRELYRREHP